MQIRKLFTAVIVTAMLAALSFTSFAQDETTFTVTIENVSGQAIGTSSGVFNTPIGAEEPGPAFPESGYQFEINAEAGDYLSFATMLVQSNDLFFGPGETGIALFDDMGAPVTGDVTDQIILWDAGTEVNEEPGVGENQAPRQAGANTGETENGYVLNIEDVDDGYEYPAVSDYISVTLEGGDAGVFTVTINNISGETNLPGPLAPGVWVVHQDAAPLFTVGARDRGQGLEGVAEDGAAAMLGTVLAGIGEPLVGPISPGVFVIHQDPAPLFTTGEADRGEGLEAIAEDGNPAGYADLENGGIFNTPIGAEEPGPAFPGSGYEFTFTANAGDYLSFATMYVQSNDIFFGPLENGIALFDDMGAPVAGDVTAYVFAWDAGTEVNEEPGIGENQAPRQAGPDTGDDEMGAVVLLDDAMDGFSYPPVAAVIRVTITINE